MPNKTFLSLKLVFLHKFLFISSFFIQIRSIFSNVRAASQWSCRSLTTTPLPHPLQAKTNKQTKTGCKHWTVKEVQREEYNKGKPTSFIRKVNSNTESNFLNYLLKVMYWAKSLEKLKWRSCKHKNDKKYFQSYVSHFHSHFLLQCL